MSHAATSHTKVATTSDTEQIFSDLAALKRDFAVLADHVKRGTANGVGDAADTMRDSVGLLGDKARNVYDELSMQGERSAKAIARQLDERPLISLLVAFGVGFVASRLLSR